MWKKRNCGVFGFFGFFFFGRQLREDNFLKRSFLLGCLEGSRDFDSTGAEGSDSFGCVLSPVPLYTRCGVLSIFGKWGFYINKIF